MGTIIIVPILQMRKQALTKNTLLVSGRASILIYVNLISKSVLLTAVLFGERSILQMTDSLVLNHLITFTWNSNQVTWVVPKQRAVRRLRKLCKVQPQFSHL